VKEETIVCLNTSNLPSVSCLHVGMSINRLEAETMGVKVMEQ